MGRFKTLILLVGTLANYFNAASGDFPGSRNALLRIDLTLPMHVRGTINELGSVPTVDRLR